MYTKFYNSFCLLCHKVTSLQKKVEKPLLNVLCKYIYRFNYKSVK